MPDTIRFDGRVAVVTGAGGGLGRDYARQLARRGAKVVINDLGGSASGTGASTRPADLVVEEIRDEGGEAEPSYDSVATRAGGEAIVQTALDRWGRLDICINNAGIMRINRFEDVSEEDIDRHIGVHLKGAFNVSQPAFRAMRKGGYGRFLFIGSSSGLFGHAWQGAYAAAKSGVLALSNIVALEGAAFGIKSNLLLPGADTRLGDQMSDGYMEFPAFAEAVRTADYAAIKGRTAVEYNTPMALYLVSERHAPTHGLFSAVCGRYARVRICVTEGWVPARDQPPPSPDDIADHFDQIGDMTFMHEPMHVYDEFNAIGVAARRQKVY